MKKIVFYIGIIIACVALFWHFNVQDSKQFIVGTSADYPPFSFFKDESISGFEIELAHEISKALNLDIQFQDMSFDSLITALQTGRIQVAVASITPTQARQQRVLFSKPYSASSTVLVSKDPVKNLKDIDGKVLGVQLGSTNEEQAKEWKKTNTRLEITSLEKLPRLVQELKIGRIFAIVLGEPEARAIVKEHPEFNLWVVPDTLCEYAIALPKNSRSLMEKINKLLQKWEEDGTLKAIKGKWNLS